MPVNGVPIDEFLDSVVSSAMTLGIFERVNQHEPKNAPGRGLSCAVWVQSIEPIRSSGLDETSVRIIFNVRLYSSMLQEPQDAIDPELTKAVALLMAVYSDDFAQVLNDNFTTYANYVRQIDLLGAYGTGLSAQAGYVNIDNRMFRTMTITLPIILNDAFDQGA